MIEIFKYFLIFPKKISQYINDISKNISIKNGKVGTSPDFFGKSLYMVLLWKKNLVMCKLSLCSIYWYIFSDIFFINQYIEGSEGSYAPKFFSHNNIIYKEFIKKIWGLTSSPSLLIYFRYIFIISIYRAKGQELHPKKIFS